jgi:hypothetical protein
MTTLHTNWGSSKDDKKIDNPEWKLIKINPNGILVTWKEKYGQEMGDTCIGLWENDSEYMLTWKNNNKVILQKSNVVSIDATEYLVDTSKCKGCVRELGINLLDTYVNKTCLACSRYPHERKDNYGKISDIQDIKQ